jgi:hypothetical protein
MPSSNESDNPHNEGSDNESEQGNQGQGNQGQGNQGQGNQGQGNQGQGNQGHDSSSNNVIVSHTDTSGNVIVDFSFNSTYDISYTVFTASSVTDICNNPPIVICFDDVSASSITVDPITHVTSTTIIDGSGYEIVNTIGTDGSTNIIRTTFATTDPSLNPQIFENLTEKFTTYDDETDPTSETDILLNQIKLYASEIQCSDFHGKGTIDDYAALFEAAGRIATESKQMELNIDVEGFNEFAAAADQLSDLFNGFIIKLQNVNIITDTTFLRSIATALAKIVNLSNTFGRFKETIFATTTIQIPKSAHDTKVVIEGVMDEVNCAMQYINYFVSPDVSLNDAKLSTVEKKLIGKAVTTIDNWNILCDQGVSIAMSDNIDIQYISNANKELKQTTVTLQNATATLRSKLAAFNISC